MKAIEIQMFAECYDVLGYKRAIYVTTVWGSRISIGGTRWALRDSNGNVVAVGNVSELHGQGQDDMYIKFKNIVCY